MHDVLDGGKTVQCVRAVLTGENWKSDEWTRDLDRRELEEAYRGWAEGSIAKGMVKVSES